MGSPIATAPRAPPQGFGKAMSIHVTRTDPSLHVQFPIALKDAFRSQFKTAKWNPGLRVWSLKNHPRNELKLQAWIKTVQDSNVLDTLRLAQEIEQADLDLDRLTTELAQLKAQRAQNRDLVATLAATRAALAAAQPRLAEVRREARQAAQDASAARQAALAHLEGLIDWNAVETAQRTMSRSCRTVGAQARNEFNQAQAVIRDARDRLWAAGLHSRGLNALAQANFNRPDRDDPRQVNQEALLHIEPLSPPEE